MDILICSSHKTLFAQTSITFVWQVLVWSAVAIAQRAGRVRDIRRKYVCRMEREGEGGRSRPNIMLELRLGCLACGRRGRILFSGHGTSFLHFPGVEEGVSSVCSSARPRAAHTEPSHPRRPISPRGRGKLDRRGRKGSTNVVMLPGTSELERLARRWTALRERIQFRR